jgi:tRNA modification GTPase
MHFETDTIAAIATPTGRGGIGVVRVSGSLVESIALQILKKLPKPRQVFFGHFYTSDDSVLDEGIALYFPAPNSFTGENILELQGHGGVVIMDLLLKRVLECGARLARAGEFSERAFLNNKIDLVQAEAIADLIDSASAHAAKCALRSLQGDFSNKINQLVEKLTYLRVFVEAGIDFSDEEIDVLADGEIKRQTLELVSQIHHLLDQAKQGYLLREGLHLVIIGKPNVGKSSLLNKLAQRDTAIVTDIPGTTRDLIRESIHLDGLPLHITDTAGLRDTNDPVEQEGIRRARQALQTADVVLLMCDDRDSQLPEIPDNLPPQCHVLIARNKCDLSEHSAGFINEKELRLSVRQEQGLNELKEWLKESVGFHHEGGVFMARRRHLDALEKAQINLKQALEQIELKNSELIAEELYQAQRYIGEITGQISADDLLGKIFSTFCIGK